MSLNQFSVVILITFNYVTYLWYVCVCRAQKATFKDRLSPPPCVSRNQTQVGSPDKSLPTEPSDLFIVLLPRSVYRHFPSHRPPWNCTAMGIYTPLLNLYFMRGRIKRILPNTRNPATWQRYCLECASDRKRKGQRAAPLMPLAPGVALPFTFAFWKHTTML